MTYTTRQKAVIRQILIEAEAPLTAADVCQQAQTEAPGLGLATVYREIKRLVKERLVRQIEGQGISPHYESTDRHHHHYFICETCKRIFPAVGCLPGIQSLAPAGFEVRHHEIFLYGTCPACRACT